jgi:two-component system, NtrC family, sensor histidine kinase KinB
MKPPSLRRRILYGSLILLALASLLGALAVPEVRHLGRAIRETLYRNYLSIQAAQHMQAALWHLQLAERDGTAAAVLPSCQEEFTHWIDVEEQDITEIGEAELAHEIDERGRRIFGELADTRHLPGTHDVAFAVLHQKLDQLIEMNRDAMFRADSRASRLGDRLTYEFVAGLVGLLLLGSVISWTLAATIAQPLSQLADRLRSFSLRGPALRLGEQPLAELQAVAVEFNKMAERLEQFEKLNIDRLIYEKSKTEAIIESLEDGIVLIDPAGTVTHINEIAAIILGVERADALGSAFDDLDSNHPHYLRVRAALRGLSGQAHELHQVEVDLRVRGRDHSYVLKPIVLPQDDGRALGTMLILQDITYLRDKDRARANLVATLSHELKTPLTSLALSAELLERRNANMDEKQRELIASVAEDVGRLRLLADNLLNLARGEVVAITLQGEPVELGQLAASIAKTFAMQAEQKGVTLNVATSEHSATITGDAVKLSWVVSNLVANALRYTPPGGAIELSATRTNGAVQLKVADTGPGIPPEVRDHLFKRFAQWSVNGAEPGSAGLGLAIAKEIVEAHGGRIFVESEVGHGTCFTVSLPVRVEGSWPSSS